MTSSEKPEQLLAYAEDLEKDNPKEFGPERKMLNLDNSETKRLIATAKLRKRYRLNFFNSADGCKLRLDVKTHDHCHNKEKYCALCGQNSTEKGSKGAKSFRGHRTRVVCKQCNVHLCIKVRPAFKRTCWDVWHSTEELKSRQPTRISRGSEESGNDCASEDGGEEQEAREEQEVELTAQSGPDRPAKRQRLSADTN